jgi:hypothetical protein
LSVTGTSSDGRRGPRPWLALGTVIAVVVIVAAVVVIATRSAPPVAKLPPLLSRAKGPEAMFTSATVQTYTPAVVAQLKAMGFDRAHIYMHWADIAPDDSATSKPDFAANDSAAYPSSGWAPYDAAIRLLVAKHINIDLDLVAPPPRWASGKGAPHPARQTEWRPSAADFEQFVHAVAVRYDGHYIPAGDTKALPRVSFWSIWNEPDLGQQLAPEAVDHSRLEVAPRYYRELVDAAWSALHATGHGKDTILIGELAPAGIRSGAGAGNFNPIPPLRFLRALYCVNSDYRHLRGIAATERGCPATAEGSATFAAQNPALFHASGVAVHPYSQGLPPNEATPDEPDYGEQAALPHVESILDRLQRIYGSDTRFPIWSTEFGYETNPPDNGYAGVTPQTAASYLNLAEYLTWLDRRQMSFDQYLLTDPPNGVFATGLETARGAPKPAYAAFLMPLYLPVTATASGHPLVVWGCVRPAHDVAESNHRLPLVHIQYSSGPGVRYRTVQTVPITSPDGYFEVHQTFPASGEVRLEWAPRHAAPQYSRVVSITLR